MRGAFAAPVALTLCSGSAFAMASNLRCVANQVDNPVYPGPVSSPLVDVYLRVQLHTLGNGVGNMSTWVSGADIVLLKGVSGATTYLSSTQWHCYSAGPASGYTVNQKLEIPPSRPGSTLQQNGKYVAVRVDRNGNIVGVVGIDGRNGSAIARTCWTSFVTNPA